ncbi:MAG: CRISPR-associated helicase Cas3' [Armatimonadota bacterium]|nr:CRISPR-associated helicase Cas3' [Armatimonadota bacterium]
MPAEPIAKGGHRKISLKRHAEEVLLCVDKMLCALDPYIDEQTKLSIKRAATFHDLGKAAEGMQKALLLGKRWNFRHELLSAAILLAAGMGEFDPLAVSAVLTHHKSLNDPKEILQDCAGINVMKDDEMFFIANWQRRTKELERYWNWIREFIRNSDPNLGEEMLSRLPKSPTALPDVREFYKTLLEQLHDYNLSAIANNCRPYIISRGLLMAADHLASSEIGSPITNLYLNPKKLRPFQKTVGNHLGSAILEAPTGSGKTLAAITWALKNRKAGERIFYVLPYQASINAMAKTLSDKNGFGLGDEAVGIIHHNALLHEFRQHFDEEIDNYEQAELTARERTDQTRQFYRPIKVITPYQILKLLFGCKRFEIGLAEMLGGLIIFDEIHAYDPHVAALIEVALSLLHSLDVRYLFMSATLPDFLKTRLSECIPDITEFEVQGKDDWEKNMLLTARHKLHLRDQYLEDMIPEILDASNKGTVLVVCNRIEQAKLIFEEIRKHCQSTFLLHGGFTAEDRLKKEQKLFRKPGSRQPACQILIATQVVEVSLDISFDTIFTEIAPVDDLLQRFGRVNRVYELGKPADVYVATNFDEDKLRWVYDLERLRLTINAAPNGEYLFPKVESKWIRDVYSSGYLQKEQEKYDLAKEAFNRVVCNLKPLHEGSDEEFYDLFDAVQVLPVELFQRYQKAIEEKRYLIAAQMFMSLPRSTYHRLRQDSAIQCETVAGNRILVVLRHYDPEIGLTDDQATLPAAII